MTMADNDQTNDNTGGGHEKTVILQRCEKHGIPYMPSEGCPECEKEKSAS